MRFRRILTAVAGLAIAWSVAAAPLQKSESLAVGPMPSSLAVDVRTGKVLIGNAGPGRGAGGSLAILDRSGKLTTVATATGPYHVAVSPALRKAVAVQPWASQATVVNIDTLEAATVATASNPTKTVIVERSATAYVLGKTQEMSMAGGVMSATSNGFITAIDLRTHATHVYLLPGFAPDDLAASPDGSRLYVVGSHFVRTGEWKPGFVQAFDTVARAPIGAPVRVGRIPQHVLVSPRADKVYVVGHADYYRAGLDPADMRRNSIRPALFVLSSETLAVERTVDLPDTKSLDLHGPAFHGQSELDPDTGRIFVLDAYNARLTSVDPVAGTQRTTEFEAMALSFALDRAAGTAIVSMNTIGQAAIVSRAGVRLDTVPIGRAPKGGEPLSGYAVAVDASSGDAYLTNGHDGSITILRRSSETASVVNLTDVWFDPDDPGWGVFVDHQGIVLFATLFTHDAAGNPTWLVMSNGVRQPDGSFSGVLFRTRGPAANAIEDITPVGIMRFTPSAADGAKLLFVVDGRSTSKTMQRFLFDVAPRPCGWSVGAPKTTVGATNFTSLWSDPREQGWGVAVSHQGSTAFGVLFTYDAENNPSWAVMSNGRQQAAGLFSGELHRAVKGRISTVGTMTLDFSAADRGALSYRVDGLDFRAPIARQAIAPLMTRCAS